MGLDTYAYHRNSDGKTEMMPDHLFAGIPPVLCGGIFSGNGCGASFRGKVYSAFISNAAGLDLYQEEIPNDTVRRAADALEVWILENPHLDFSDISRAEIRALADWFRVVANNGGFVTGWW
jgi:hypothetical protein